MGVCLGKLHSGVRAIETQPLPAPLSILAASPPSNDATPIKANKTNHVVPKRSESEKSPAAERQALPPRERSATAGPPRSMQRALTASSRSGKRATFAVAGGSNGGSLLGDIDAAAAATALFPTRSSRNNVMITATPPATPTPATSTEVPAASPAKARRLSVQLQRGGSTRCVDELPRDDKKRVDVTLDVLLKDERARVGFFHFLRATPMETDAIPEDVPQAAPLESPARIQRQASKLPQNCMPPRDYREDCVLFWLEISDLLKIPTGGSFHLGLMQDLFDVYVSKNAPRLLPMVSSAEREPLAQFLTDRNADRALLAFKMVLLDVLEIVTAAFDEYVRCETKLGFVQVTRCESMHNVLARIAKVNIGLASNDRRAQLNDIVNTPQVCRMFREFLQERNSVENLLFIVDALAFEDLVNSLETENEPNTLSEGDQASRHDYCLRQAQKIFKKYIRFGSKAEICLSASVKATLLQSVVEYPLRAQVFNDAVLLCSAELVQSHLDTFYRSQEYIQFQVAKRESTKGAGASMQRPRSRTISRRNSARTAGLDGDDLNTIALSAILNGVGVNFFRNFLKQENAENTLLFYKEVEQFQLLPHGQKHYIQIKARRIFDRFVRRGGKLEIELPMDVRRDILFKLSSPSEFTFVDALKHVVNLWEAQHLPTFRTHALYNDMLRAMETTPPPLAAVVSSVDLVTRRDSTMGYGTVGNDIVSGPPPSTPPTGSSGDWVDITMITLREFLELEFLRKYFRQYLEKEQCVNELHFYFEIATFQQLPTSDYLTRQAKKLYNRFCDPQSRECVVLRDDLNAELQQSLSHPGPAMFRKIQDEIYGFFQSTLFPKFQQSEIYRAIQLTNSQLNNARNVAMGGFDEEADGTRRAGMEAIANAGTRAMDAMNAPHSRGNRQSVGAIFALPELHEESVSMVMILENAETRALFLLFAEEIFCTESIYFWLDCNEFKDIPHRNYLKLRAQKIFRKYISSRAKLQVNLDSAISNEIVQNLDDPSRTLFLTAQKSITKMLERDTLPKFRKSKYIRPQRRNLKHQTAENGISRSTMLHFIDAAHELRRAELAADSNGSLACSDSGGSDVAHAKSAPVPVVAVRVSPVVDAEAEPEDFGIAPSTLEVVATSRLQWIRAHEPPLAVSASPLLDELSRGWRVLRLKPAHPLDGLVKKRELSAEHTLLKNYEPRVVNGEPTFPSQVCVPAYLQPRVAVEDAAAFLVTTRLRFALGMLEPFYCRLVVYDVQLGCRVSEEFAFTIPISTGATHRTLPRALFYILPAHSVQNIYIVLKVSKGLFGDADAVTAPYCNPEKFAAVIDQQRLSERAVDSGRRLGKYLQPLAWGAIALGEVANRPVTMYRQRVTISDEQRIPMIVEAARGALKEKNIPAMCELNIERIDDQRLEESKFQLKALKTLSKDSLKLPSAPILDMFDPFTARKAVDAAMDQAELNNEDEADADSAFYECHEVQPLCHQSMVSLFGLCGSGPVAVSYVNAMYVYPLRVDRFPFRNVAVRVQLLQSEVEFICGIDDFEAQNVVIRAFYGPDRDMVNSVFAHVNYHQKNPQFEREVKLCLPEQLTPSHHLLFTFFHVHCKKLQPTQQQQELVGCCALPILGKGGALLEDSEFVFNVIPASVASKNSTSGGIVSLPPGYVDAARTLSSPDGSKTTFAVRTRALSSIRSQDPSIATFVEPFQSKPLKAIDVPTNEQVIARLVLLQRASATMVRHLFFPITRFLLGYMRFAVAAVRHAAFRTLLSVFEKTSWNGQRSTKDQDTDVILEHYVALAFDDEPVENCAAQIPRSSSTSLAPGGLSPQSTLQAVVVEWLRVLKDKSDCEDAQLAKRLSLSYSSVFLQLILKAMALQRPQKGSTLPQRANGHDDILVEDLLVELIENSTNQANGLLIQKEVNVNTALFCRGLFLVTKSALPIRVVKYFLGWTQRLQGDINVTVHILFPFLNSLIEFEFFAIINGFQPQSSSTNRNSRRGAWLARLIFERLLKVVDEQVEDRIRSEAVRLLRRMFVLQVNNPRHQHAEQQELIALMYFPMIPAIARFTTDGKLLAAGPALAEAVENSESEQSQLFRKELLVCVAHLLSSVTLPYLSWYFRQSALIVCADPVEQGNENVSLSPTASLIHYRTLVEETKLRAPTGRRQSLIQRNLDKAFATSNTAARATVYDEIRVHACLSLVRQVIEVFLVDEPSTSSTAALQILSPDLLSRDRRISLLELETHLKQRRSRHRGGSVSHDNFTAQPRASGTSGSKSPNSKFGGGSGSFNSGHPPRLASQKSMPRNWGKNYANAQQRSSMTASGDGTKTTSQSLSLPCGNSSGTKKPSEDQDTDSTSDAFESNTRNLHRIVADTALKAIRTAIDQFEWVVRIIEAPLDYRTTTQRKNFGKITMDHAFTLLGSIVDIFFLLMKRASSIECLCTSVEGEMEEELDDEADCFLADLFRHLQTFLLRFKKALFATRVTGLPLVHDQSRIFLLISLSATAKLSSVRQLAASLLCQLLFVCYEQTGSFLLVKRPMIKVFCSNFFSAASFQIPTDALRDAIELWRQQPLPDGDNNQLDGPGFELQLHDTFNSLTSQIKVFETWHTAMTEPDALIDSEELEEGLYRVVQSVSPFWLLEVKIHWMDALVQLHAARKQYAEATCCTYERITFQEEVERSMSQATIALKRSGASTPAWIATELRNARELAQQAGWMEKVVEINERLLVSLRQTNSFLDYRETLRSLDSAIQQLAETAEQPIGQSFAFYRVIFAGDCVPLSVSTNEYIYKRSKFVSLGEFVGEMKGMLRARFPSSERVDILPESKPTPALERNPNVIFMRVTNLERMQDGWQQGEGETFRFSTPFTLCTGTSYGKTAEQMKRVVFLITSRAFPCVTSRQIVAARREEVRCPVDNSMDDVRKRCGLLQDEVDKEKRGQTDLKTLTLVLKGSVDTHVHGGIPEVVDAFLAYDGGQLPVLIDIDGKMMVEPKATEKREELADLLVDFLELCWICLLISRLAFRRASTNQLQSALESPAKQLSSALPCGSSSIVRVLTALNLPVVDDDASPSPLQVEFERGFAILINQMQTKVAGFAYTKESDLLGLVDHVQRHYRPHAQSTFKQTTTPLSTSSLVLLSPPPPLSPASAVLPSTNIRDAAT